MNVKQLIAALKRFPKNKRVYIFSDEREDAIPLEMVGSLAGRKLNSPIFYMAKNPDDPNNHE